ncbi:hypothetical protein EHQ75_10620 [Leptospira levettii]|uniref:hypothetical protein n=1 Tax=Leptospira levettii TaxID=2023178 RepID=UPI0010FFE575|nr:hypothetical protein [Leptospira levettii]TGM39446.1 hypothetical protein EHQ75_10620 [Leptospira levettii]
MFLNITLKILIIALMILAHIHCSNQKDQCIKMAETKGGEKYQDSSSACATYIVLEGMAKTNEEQGKSPFIERLVASEALAICIVKAVEERKCQSKSELIPHFGY